LINVILYLLAFSSPVVWYFLSFHGFVCFHFLCAGFLEDTFVVVAWWSYIDLVSAYHGKLLLLHLFFFIFILFLYALHLFWMIVLLGRVS
jgi:hypothetical protein